MHEARLALVRLVLCLGRVRRPMRGFGTGLCSYPAVLQSGAYLREQAS
jgi:hypothetical protein